MSFWRESVRCDLDIRPAAVSFQLCWAPLLLVTNLAGRSSILRCCAKAASCQRGCWPRARSRFRWRTARPCAGASARRRRSSGRGRPTSRRRTIPGGDRSSPPPRARRPEDEAARAGRRAVDLWTSPADRARALRGVWTAGGRCDLSHPRSGSCARHEPAPPVSSKTHGLAAHFHAAVVRSSVLYARIAPAATEILRTNTLRCCWWAMAKTCFRRLALTASPVRYV